MNKSKLLLSITLTLFSFFAFANNPSMVWIKAFDQNGITVYYNVETCNGKDMIYFRVENKGNESRQIIVNGSLTDAKHVQDFSVPVYLQSNASVEMNCGEIVTPVSCCMSFLYKFINPIVRITAK